MKHTGKYLSTLFSFCMCTAIIPSLTLIIRLKHCISICGKKCRCLNKQCRGRNLFESLQNDVYTKNEIPSRQLECSYVKSSQHGWCIHSAVSTQQIKSIYVCTYSWQKEKLYRQCRQRIFEELFTVCWSKGIVQNLLQDSKPIHSPFLSTFLLFNSFLFMRLSQNPESDHHIWMRLGNRCEFQHSDTSQLSNWLSDGYFFIVLITSSST